jgi:dsDNA-specific endonuclease/ATPase MutS2
MEVDLHGFELADAVIEINYALKEISNNGEKVVKFIHGYHSGSILQGYIRSPKFLKQMKKNGYNLKRLKSSNQGTTSFQIL